MPERIHWNDSYFCGIEEIDFQHQYFAKLINRLDVELGKTDDMHYRARLLEELNKYAHFHFLSEENLMIAMKYPQLREHQRLHYDLLDKLNLYCMKLDMAEIDENSVLDFLVSWFNHHTVVEDKKIAAHAGVESDTGHGN